MQDSELKKYELMVIFSGEMPETEYEKQLTELRGFLKENTAGIFYEDTWGRRDLSYKIKKQRTGYYVIFDFNAAPAALAEIGTTVKLNNAVLRSLLLALPENYESGRYKSEMLPEEKREPSKRKGPMRMRPGEVAADKVPHARKEEESVKIISPKEQEEKLKNVEKKLEEILENPDIDIR